MDFPLPAPNRPAAGTSPSPEVLQNEIRSLRLALLITLMALILLGGGVGLFMYRQVTLLGRQTDATTRVAQQMVQNFNVNLKTQAQNFEKQLLDFARANADFQARLAKYYSNGLPAAAAPTPPPAPALPQ